MATENGKQELVERLLDSAGVHPGGDKPWDIQVHDPRFYRRLLSGGSLALGESYMDGWWDAGAPDQFFHKVLSADLDKQIRRLSSVAPYLKSLLFNLQTRRGSTKVAKAHYDLTVELYMAFLDPYNQYTCGYFRDTDDLNEAQEQKLDLICRKLQLSAGQHVLDIGCGWGGFAKFAVERFGVRVTGITISDKQVGFARQFTAGLPVEIMKLDYRDLQGTWDKVLVCGMIEHVGRKNYRTLMKVVRRSLSDGGLFLLQTIGEDDSSGWTDPWIAKYIFPNSVLPSVKLLTAAAEGALIVEDWHAFGAYYDKTLMAWHGNFVKNWPSLKATYDERFYRMWEYYLLSSAGAFRANKLRLWQVVFSRDGVTGAYAGER